VFNDRTHVREFHSRGTEWIGVAKFGWVPQRVMLLLNENTSGSGKACAKDARRWVIAKACRRVLAEVVLSSRHWPGQMRALKNHRRIAASDVRTVALSEIFRAVLTNIDNALTKA
jgi:hypothetical protein